MCWIKWNSSAKENTLHLHHHQDCCFCLFCFVFFLYLFEYVIIQRLPFFLAFPRGGNECEEEFLVCFGKKWRKMLIIGRKSNIPKRRKKNLFARQHSFVFLVGREIDISFRHLVPKFSKHFVTQREIRITSACWIQTFVPTTKHRKLTKWNPKIWNESNRYRLISTEMVVNKLQVLDVGTAIAGRSCFAMISVDDQ